MAERQVVWPNCRLDLKFGHGGRRDGGEHKNKEVEEVEEVEEFRVLEKAVVRFRIAIG